MMPAPRSVQRKANNAQGDARNGPSTERRCGPDGDKLGRTSQTTRQVSMARLPDALDRPVLSGPVPLPAV